MSRTWSLPAWGVAVGLLGPAVAVLALALTGDVQPSVPGLPDAGPLTRWGLPAARGVHDGAAAVTVGALVLAAGVVPPEPGGSREVLSGPRAQAVRLAGVTALVWVLAGTVVLVLTYADLAGTDPLGPDVLGQVVYFAGAFDLGRSLAASVLLAAVVATGSWLATRVTTAGVLAALSLAALLPLALAGHASGASNHDIAVDALAAHLVGVTVWVGGLAVLVLLRRRLGEALGPAVARYSTLAAWCFVLVAVSGVLGAVVRLEGVAGLTTPYGALLGAKVLALALLGTAGWWHRRRLVGTSASGAGGRRWFARFAAAEVVLMAVAMGLAVALTRTSPADPLAAPELETTAESLLGYPMPPPLTAARWFTEWRIDVLWVSVAVFAAAWYVTAVVRLRRRGDRWPVMRAVSWVFACVGLVWATSAGPGVYGPVLFSMHMVQHMTIAMAVPVFLVLGAPITLALRTLPARRDGSRGLREWLLLLVHARYFRVLAHPAVAGAMFAGSLVVFYYSPLFELALRTHTGHVLMTAHFLLTGYLFSWVICGPDPGPQRPPYPLRLVMLIATFAFHAFVGIAMMGGTEILGEEWFSALPRDWGPTLAEDQYSGGALAWGLGDYPIGILVVAMSLAWVRSDTREARRYDRKAERDGDAELADYNSYLRGLPGGRGAHAFPEPAPAAPAVRAVADDASELDGSDPAVRH